MNVQYVFGPNAGTTAHVPRDQFIDILIKAGVLELVEEPAERARVQPPGPTVQFGLKEMPTSGEWVIVCTDNRSTLFFTGKASELATHDFWMCGKANRCPPELVTAYRAKRQAYGYLSEDKI